MNFVVQIMVISRERPSQPTYVAIIYSLIRFNRQNCTPASDAVDRIHLVPEQQVAIMLDYVVIVAAESK
jgi:hypothetical protein